MDMDKGRLAVAALRLGCRCWGSSKGRPCVIGPPLWNIVLCGGVHTSDTLASLYIVGECRSDRTGRTVTLLRSTISSLFHYRCFRKVLSRAFAPRVVLKKERFYLGR